MTCTYIRTDQQTVTILFVSILRSGNCLQPSNGGGLPWGMGTGRLPSALGPLVDGPEMKSPQDDSSGLKVMTLCLHASGYMQI